MVFCSRLRDNILLCLRRLQKMLVIAVSNLGIILAYYPEICCAEIAMCLVTLLERKTILKKAEGNSLNANSFPPALLSLEQHVFPPMVDVN